MILVKGVLYNHIRSMSYTMNLWPQKYTFIKIFMSEWRPIAHILRYLTTLSSALGLRYSTNVLFCRDRRSVELVSQLPNVLLNVGDSAAICIPDSSSS